MNVPFVDLAGQYQSLKPEIDAALRGVLDRCDFVLGRDVALFEEEFARYCGARYAVGVDSGLSALELTMRAVGIGPGDEVITAANTFIATVSAITLTGATPVLVDVDPRTCNLDPGQVQAAITPATRVILPVHLYGQPADMDALAALGERSGLQIIEDACQAHGARYKGKAAGTFGAAGCFSFHPVKNLGACGDGGMVVTNDEGLAEQLRILRNYGQREKYHHVTLALNRRLDTMQAAILRVKLRHLDAWNAKRREVAARYQEGLRGHPSLTLPTAGPGREHVYHLFVVGHDQRDELQRFLKGRGVASGLHYPIPIHLQPSCAGLGYATGSFPVSEMLAGRLLSLPMFPEITPEQCDHVIASVRAFQVRRNARDGTLFRV